MTTYENAVNEAKNRTGAEGMIDRLAERVGSGASSHAVFGDPVERDGVTVIPVAKIRWGVGGGGGGGADEEHHRTGEGSGGGAGMMATPVGYIEIMGGEAHFRRIVDPVALWPVLLVGGMAGWLLFRGFRSIFR